MANFLASIFGTELDKVNCSFYFVSFSFASPSSSPISSRLLETKQEVFKNVNRIAPENRRLPPWRPLLQETRQALLQPDHPHAQPLPKPRLRSQEPHEPRPAPKPLRRLLRGRVVRVVQIRRVRRTRSLRQQ